MQIEYMTNIAEKLDKKVAITTLNPTKLNNKHILLNSVHICSQ